MVAIPPHDRFGGHRASQGQIARSGHASGSQAGAKAASVMDATTSHDPLPH
jgi:hypothetical protein